MEQDDTMENSDVNSDNVPQYRSNYPDIRRYSVVTPMMGIVGGNMGRQDSSNDDDEKKETKVDIPSGIQPTYAPHAEKNSDKKVKVSKNEFLLQFFGVVHKSQSFSAIYGRPSNFIKPFFFLYPQHNTAKSYANLSSHVFLIYSWEILNFHVDTNVTILTLIQAT